MADMPGGNRAALPWIRPARFRALAVALLLALVLAPAVSTIAADEPGDEVVASRLADFLRAARSVISQNQKLINDPAMGDKGLTGDRVLADAAVLYQKQTGEDPFTVSPETKEGRLLRAQMDAIKAVMQENQGTINTPGVAFKGFIPAVFARLVNEKFEERVGTEARMKVTAPVDLIRNRKARPDAWEVGVLESKFEAPGWTKGAAFSETTEVESRPAFRLLVPEYYTASCLSCHGEPRGEMDITGYPKEGGKEGDLGAAISVTLFQ